MQVERLAAIGHGPCCSYTVGAELEVKRTGVLLLFSVESIIERGIHKFQSDIFLKVAKQTEGKLTVDVITKISKYSFFELFIKWNTKTPFT